MDLADYQYNDDDVDDHYFGHYQGHRSSLYGRCHSDWFRRLNVLVDELRIELVNSYR